jgi:hypothetical protein
MDRVCGMPQRAAHASRQPVVHCPGGGRAGAAHALQHAPHEFVAQLFAQRPLAGVFVQGRSPYTQMYLTHIDRDGNDSPPILIDNATAANRAVNIPEFVNVPPDGLRQIGGPVDRLLPAGQQRGVSAEDRIVRGVRRTVAESAGTEPRRRSRAPQPGDRAADDGPPRGIRGACFGKRPKASSARRWRPIRRPRGDSTIWGCCWPDGACGGSRGAIRESGRAASRISPRRVPTWAARWRSWEGWTRRWFNCARRWNRTPGMRPRTIIWGWF